MYFNKLYFLLICALIGIALSLFNFSILKKEYALGNIYGNQGLEINLLDLHAKNFLGNFRAKFFQFDTPGLLKREFIIPEKSIQFLNSNLPHNIKKENQAFLRYPDGDFQKIKIRYRGDNFFNWAYGKKNYRVELKKKKLLEGTREFNYSMLFEEDSFSTYIPYYLGSMLELPTPKASLVELIINGYSQGPVMEYQQLDETFLRASGFMPVNLYKGEQFHTGRDREKGIELFNNPALWTKGATFNQREKNDHRDLGNFINHLIQADSAISNYYKFEEFVDLNAWARFDALQTLIQSEHNDDEHNMRIISDLWKGKIIPVVYELNMSLDPSREIIFENSKHSLFKILHRSSNFLYQKYNFLYSFLENEVLSKASKHVDELIPVLGSSWLRDPALNQLAITGRWTSGHTLQDMQPKWKGFSENLVKRESKLLDILRSEPLASFAHNKTNITLVVDGVVPLKKPTFLINTMGLTSQPKIYFDVDGDKKISSNDLFIPSSIRNNELILDASFFANRVSYKKDYFNFLTHEITQTNFSLISDTELEIISGNSEQFFTGKKFNIPRSSSLGVTPNHLNHPVIPNQDSLEIWSGDILIKDDLVVNNRVKILPGTEIFLDENASIIFKNHVEAVGSEFSKIKFVPMNGSIWKTIALIGNKTSASVFHNVTIDGGSGYELDSKKFTGMFSIHDTHDISLTNISFSNNYFYDDLIHIVYSKDILLKNCTINNARSDAIDIDISFVVIQNCQIKNSGNDGIDSMTSVVAIRDTSIYNSGDKAVSVGENSKVLIINSLISGNNIGVEAKDISVADIYESEFHENELDVNAYLKNWQYGGGGVVRFLDKSIILKSFKLKTDKKSSIYLYDEKYDTLPSDKSLNIFSAQDSIPYFQQNTLEKIFQFWDEIIFIN